MNFLERENMLDDINAQIESSKKKISTLTGGDKGEISNNFKEYVKKLIGYLENTNSNEKRISYQIKKLKKYL